MRSTWIRQISAIRKDGVESAINLTCGLNCVIGASNTGKTRIAKTVEFVCGGKETPFTDKTAYEVAQVTFITNDGEVSLSRSTRTQNTIHVESSNPAVASGSYSVSSRSGKSINTVLLALLGIEPTRRIATNETYHTVAFTWNAVRHLMLVPEDQVGRPQPSILFPKSTTLTNSHTKFVLAACLGPRRQNRQLYADRKRQRTSYPQKSRGTVHPPAIGRHRTPHQTP